MGTPVQLPHQDEDIGSLAFRQFFKGVAERLNGPPELIRRAQAALPDPARNKDRVYLLTDGVQLPVFSDGIHWRTFAGTIIV